MNRDILSIWTVYDHPKDYPLEFVARRWEVHPERELATLDVIRNKDLEPIREEMRRRGLFQMNRFAGDDPKIVETWM